MPATNFDSPSSEGGTLSGNDLLLRRQRLAQMIGHLLARTWVQRRRDPQGTSTADVEPRPTQLPTDPPSADC